MPLRSYRDPWLVVHFWGLFSYVTLTHGKSHMSLPFMSTLPVSIILTIVCRMQSPTLVPGSGTLVHLVGQAKKKKKKVLFTSNSSAIPLC